jgi:hypothetical protein
VVGFVGGGVPEDDERRTDIYVNDRFYYMPTLLIAQVTSSSENMAPNRLRTREMS